MGEKQTLSPGNGLAGVLITGQLSTRMSRAPDYKAESEALSLLGREMADNPHGVMQKLAELVLELCGADSSGVSILEPDGAVGIFRVQAAAGALAPTLGGTIPRATSPCGIVLERNELLLFRDAGRHFAALHDISPRVYEILLAPWTTDGQAVGTVWAIGHSPDMHFDREDARLLQSLARFAAAAHRTVTERDEAEAARAAVEREVAERTRELKRSNELLREQYALMSAAMAIETVGVSFFTLDGEVLAANRGLEQMSGFTEDELRALPALSLTPPEFMDATHKAAYELAQAGHTAPYEKQLLRKDGTRFWALCAPSRLSGSGRQSRCVEFILDITQRTEVEAALRESEERFRALADASPALIFQFDAGGRAVYLNQRFATLVGCQPALLLGAGWQEIVHPDDLQGGMDALARSIRERSACHMRARLRAADGQWRWYESHSVPWYGADGDYRGLVGIAIDITDAVQAERALRDADRRKDEFLATLAHELRNPLAPISNAVRLLGRPDGRRSADRLVEMVERQVRHIVRLVDDLMEVSRITRGKLELNMEPLELSQAVQAALEISQPAIDQGRHQLTVTLPAEPLRLVADKVRLTQVFANLLNNAAKFTDPGGKISLTAWREGDEALVAVRDTGVGIAPEQLPRVFEMFAQVQREGARGVGGLGIGLTMARSLVDLHGGSIGVASEGPGHGSEFMVRLPLAPPAPGALGSSEPNVAHAPLAGRRVLVVDDNRDAADSLALLLEADGAVVQVAYNGEAALRAVESFVPHAMLLDLGMPGMDGYEVAQRLQPAPGKARPLLVALTGWGQESDRRATSASGFDYHLTKPVDLATLTMLLRQQH
jgi:two-component system CheB/CheR fusion protein